MTLHHAATPTAPRHVLVVGGGLCGVALTLRLLARHHETEVTVVERGPNVGRGVAYDTPDPEHLLNVPANAMSLDPDAPDDFVAWAVARGLPATGSSLLPRRVFGDYVVERFADARQRHGERVTVVAGEVVGLDPTDVGWRATLADGTVRDADDVVLATGNAPPRVPDALRPLVGDPRLLEDPWAPGALDRLSPDDDVLIVGTGLTSVDVVMTLKRRGHRGALTTLSRNGRWPLPHLPQVCWSGPRPSFDAERAPRTADGLAAWLRGHLDEAGAAGIPWQAVFGSLKPHVATLWSRLPDDERRAFLTRYRGAWEVARHRVPAHIHASLRGWHDDGTLSTRAAHLVSAAATTSGLTVTCRCTRDGTEQQLTAHKVVVCTGAEADVTRIASPLWTQLTTAGLARPDPHGLGVRTDHRALLDGADGPVRGLWALGGLLRPLLFESTSVPELVEQAEVLARVLAVAQADGLADVG